MPRSTKANADLNKQKLFEEARRQFASRGFDAASIGAIASEVGLTKQTLLYHFGSKEKLFSAVLEDLAATLDQRIEQARVAHKHPAAQLAALMWEILDSDGGDDDFQIVIRELLENHQRAPEAGNWHLKNYLGSLADMVMAIPGNSKLSDAEAFAKLYFVLGAVSYLKISQPTLKGMVGDKKFLAIQQSFKKQVKLLLS